MKVPIDFDMLQLLILQMPGGKFVKCESAVDFSPHVEPGQKYIDHITEPENRNFAIMRDGTILSMQERNAFEIAIADKADIVAIFSLPFRNHCFAAFERSAAVLTPVF